jgi:cellulose biosynthesis protein BcsQ
VNVAAALARHSAVSDRVCVVDADPLSLDVTTRLAVGGPTIEDFAKPELPNLGRLGRLHSPAMAVVPSSGGPAQRVRLAADRALPVLGDAFDVIVADLPGGPTGPGLVLGGRLDVLDWLVLAVTPERTAVAAAAHFLEHFETAKRRGDISDVQLAIVCTGDENSTTMSEHEVADQLDAAVAGRIPQLWGRAAPNKGFGPALAIPELDDAVYDVFVSFRLGRDHRAALATL